jgi:hypothetical protein
MILASLQRLGGNSLPSTPKPDQWQSLAFKRVIVFNCQRGEARFPKTRSDNLTGLIGVGMRLLTIFVLIIA